MKHTFLLKASRLIAAGLCTTMFATTVSFAESNDTDNQISVIMDNCFNANSSQSCIDIIEVNENNPTMLQGSDSLARDLGYPRYYHDLSSSEYHYAGSVTDHNLYTLKYYKPTSDGKIFLEGMGTTNISQFNDTDFINLVVDIYDKSTNQCLASFPLDSDCILHSTSDHTDFFYRFAIINLNPDKNYFIAFHGDQIPFSLVVEGYIAHDWTYHYDY